MTFVEKGVNFDGGEVFLWVSTANFGQDVCVGGGGLVKLGLGPGGAGRRPNKPKRGGGGSPAKRGGGVGLGGGGGGACQVGFGTWVASQMPNQLDR